MQRRYWYISMVLIGLLVVPSAAEIIFVPDSISTIQAAIDSAATGDTIIVAQGLYKENLNLYDKNIVLASNFLLDPAAEHILNTIINGDSAGNVVRIDGDAKLIGFTLTNGYDINGHGAAILCEHPFSDELPPVKPEFRNLVLTGNHGNTGNIYFLYVDAIITNVAIVNNAGTGISISDHGKAIVTNVTAYNDPWTDGTDFSLVPVGFSNVIVINSILSNIYTSTAELILYNTRVGTIWNEWVDGGGNIFADPSFIDSITYALTDSSPCIGAGLDSVLVGDLWYHAPAIDLLGNPRPAPGFSKPDMGAYENELSIPLIAKIYIPNFTISFDSTLVDSTSMKNLTVYNQGIVELKIDSIYTDNEQFQVENFSSIIPAGDSTTLMIHFVPTQQGEISGFLVIQSNDPLRPTVNINLRGTGKTPSSIDINNQKVPLTFSLKQCYPNPFNPLTTIEYSLAQKSEVELIIFNTLAQQIRTLVSRFQNAGNYTIVWDGTDQQGLMVSSGIYIYRIKAGTFSSSKKMSFLR